VKPYQPPGLWNEVAMADSNTQQYLQDNGEALYRRTVYTFWKRSSPPPSLETFDATAREVTCPRRARANTPLQALTTLNNPEFVQAARMLAQRVIRTESAADARFDLLARLTLSRTPDAEE